MKVVLSSFVLFIFTYILSSHISQAAEVENQSTYVYATYFKCDPDAEQSVDKLVEQKYVPIYQQAVKDKIISGYGWLSHHTGGEWRRLLVFSAPTVEQLFKSQIQIQDRMSKAFGDGSDALSSGCRSHEDYVWQMVAGSAMEKDALQARGEATMSVYMECDISMEDQVDEIVQNDFAPIYNRYVKEGKLASWGFLTHVIGGKYRKLSTMSASSYEQLLKARASLIQEIFYQGNNSAASRFSEICGAHRDYLWTIEKSS
ncbi:hypothetical protein [Thalassotalea aquiviva]|uniref:hypothetical protein n=1 Tax=Thalassotalea aquiviva TaxID=3242415 RepID=UPI00352B7BC4